MLGFYLITQYSVLSTQFLQDAPAESLTISHNL
jgi:hypothetical protein